RKSSRTTTRLTKVHWNQSSRYAMKPTTSPSASATIRWCRSMWERMKAGARSSPMSWAARVVQPTESATRGSGISITGRTRRLVGAGADALEELLELVGGEAGALAHLDDLALVGLDLGDGLRDLRRDVRGDRAEPLVVAVDQVARLDPQAADLDRDAEVHHVHVGVGDRHVGGAELEAERAHLVQIAHRAVGDDAHTTQCAVNVGLHLAPLGALTPRVVEVVDHDHVGRRDAEHEVPPAVGAGPVALDGARLGADDAGDGVAHHRPHLREERADSRGDVALLARPHLEGLDGVGDAGAGDLLERFDLLGGERHGVLPVGLTAGL